MLLIFFMHRVCLYAYRETCSEGALFRSTSNDKGIVLVPIFNCCEIFNMHRTQTPGSDMLVYLIQDTMYFFQTLILIHVAYSKRGFCAHALIYSCSRVKIGHGDKGSDTISAATSSRFRRFCQTRSLRRFGQLGVKKKSRPTLCNKHAQEKKQ